MTKESAGDVVRSHRTARRLSQAQVGVAAGITEGAISQFETGRTAPSFTTAAKIDAYLEADGEILRAYGYVVPRSPEVTRDLAVMQERLDQLASTADREVELQQQMVALVEQVRSLAATVHVQGAELERLRARLDQRGS